MDIPALQVRLDKFAKDRDWEQYHSPKNLAMALGGEVGELLELFQWKTEEESCELKKEALERELIAQELADIMIYAIRLSDRLGIDLETAVDNKININEEKYPIELVKGDATKYNRRSE